MSTLNLLGTSTYVSAPCIVINIGGYTFGAFSKTLRPSPTSANSGIPLTRFPNFITGMTVQKINGTVNIYTINLTYAVTPGMDPNLLEKVFGTIAQSRELKITYGDYASPNFVFREEEAIITNIKSKINFSGSKIDYVITCTSKALGLTAGTYTFPSRKDKPSTIIKELLYDTSYGLLEVFTGMHNRSLVESLGLIASNDQPVEIPAKKGLTVFQYLTFLVGCMVSITDSLSADVLNKSTYALSVYDDYDAKLGGTYFKVRQFESYVEASNTLDMYEIQIGFPTQNHVLSFSIDDDETYSILYDYSQELKTPDYHYAINDDGDLEAIYSPALTMSPTLRKTVISDKNWWSKLTSFPIKATLEIQGLLRPAMLLSYVKLDVRFWGQKHISSGVYIITKQVDSINSSGYRTTLSLTRIAGVDEHDR